jgi:protein TonB
MAYRPRASLPARLFAIGFAVAIQVVLIWGLASGLIQKGIKNALTEIETTVLPPPPPPPDTPPPPPPVDVPPPYIPPPDLSIEAPSSQSAPTQIQNKVVTNTAIIPPKPRASCGLPDYPARDKQLGHEGRVVLTLCVSGDGAITSAAVKSSSGFPALDQSALVWAQGCRWTPAKIGGQIQANFCYDQPYRFQIRNQ